MTVSFFQTINFIGHSSGQSMRPKVSFAVGFVLVLAVVVNYGGYGVVVVVAFSCPCCCWCHNCDLESI